MRPVEAAERAHRPLVHHRQVGGFSGHVAQTAQLAGGYGYQIAGRPGVLRQLDQVKAERISLFGRIGADQAPRLQGCENPVERRPRNAGTSCQFGRVEMAGRAPDVIEQVEGLLQYCRTGQCPFLLTIPVP